MLVFINQTLIWQCTLLWTWAVPIKILKIKNRCRFLIRHDGEANKQSLMAITSFTPYSLACIHLCFHSSLIPDALNASHQTALCIIVQDVQ